MVIDDNCQLIVSTVVLALICNLIVIDCCSKKDDITIQDASTIKTIKDPMTSTTDDNAFTVKTGTSTPESTTTSYNGSKYT